MPLTEAYTLSAVTISATGANEHSIPGNTSGAPPVSSIAAAGIYQLFLDAGNMAKGDEYIVRVREKVLTGSTQKIIAEWVIQGVQSENFVTPTFILLHGWDMTITKVTGTDRAFSASVRKVA